LENFSEIDAATESSSTIRMAEMALPERHPPTDPPGKFTRISFAEQGFG
jgi:hypothetical protein